MFAMFRHAMSSTTADKPMRSAVAAANGPSVCGWVLVDMRGSRFTVSAWSLFSAGNAAAI